LILTADERETLVGYARRGKTAQALALRARIVLAAAEGATNKDIAARLGIACPTVGKWRSRFVFHRLGGLRDEPRSGAPRTLDDDRIERLVVRTLETTPSDVTHWSVRSMAAACGISKSSVARVWKAFNLQPHRQETFKLSADPEFIAKVRDIVGLYMSLPERAVVLCVDEKSQIQALERTQPLLPMRPGVPERRTHDYVRHGTVSLFSALNARTGEVIGKCYARHRSDEFVDFLAHVDEAVRSRSEPGVEVHLILDNYATHKTPRVKRWLQRHPEYRLHFTPTSSSWLNLVERFFSEITTRRIRRGSFASAMSLRRAIESYIEARNEDPKPFRWTKPADLIFRKVAEHCERTSGTGH
jgi:transposase